jgi:hypothetical protein
MFCMHESHPCGRDVFPVLIGMPVAHVGGHL